MEQIFKILPINIRELLSKVNLENITEIRLRVGKNIYVYKGNEEIKINYIVNLTDLITIIKNVSSNSIYSVQQDINSGFILVDGGHRIGLVGDVVYLDQKIKNIKNISSMNIRIARQIKGVANKIINYIYENGKVSNTLIVSPPACGKTTMLKDVIRNISNYGKNVSVIDERGELAAKFQGEAMLDLGDRTDILSFISKKDGFSMCLRSMAPDVICTDEIGDVCDVQSLINIAKCGVKFITTMHASNYEDVCESPIYELILKKYLDVVIVLSKSEGMGTIERVIRLNS